MAERWWEIRPAQNRKPQTYTCPLCGRKLPALTEHALITPEGDSSRRRHAHIACVRRARAAGRLPTRDEYRRTQRTQDRRAQNATPWWRRLWRRDR